MFSLFLLLLIMLLYLCWSFCFLLPLLSCLLQLDVHISTPLQSIVSLLPCFIVLSSPFVALSFSPFRVVIASCGQSCCVVVCCSFFFTSFDSFLPFILCFALLASFAFFCCSNAVCVFLFRTALDWFFHDRIIVIALDWICAVYFVLSFCFFVFPVG